MARIVVVGGGFAGMATAARLAKLGHSVQVLERSATLGGALASESADGFTWDSGPTTTLLPAVVRDLFRKSGRPLEREVDLQPLDLVREHRFADGSVLALPGGSRATQLHAVEALGPGLGQQWVEHVASYGPTWELLRREWYERVWSADVEPRELRALLSSRRSLHTHLRKAFGDERLRLVAGHALLADGHDLRDVPAWAGLHIHLEQRFGTWTVPGGLAALGSALSQRLATRGVTVHTGTEVRDVVVRSGRAVAVATDAGEVDADVVVVAIDPHRLPALAAHVRKVRSTTPPAITHLGLEGQWPDLPHEIVLHGDPLAVVRTTGQAPAGATAWTLHVRGRARRDPLEVLAAHGLAVQGRVTVRVDHSPESSLQRWGGSPMGVLWRGARTAHERLGPRTPVPGVLAAGAHSTTGSGLPFAGLSAALVAAVVGPA